MKNTQATPPDSLSEEGITSFTDVARANYAKLCAMCGASDVRPPPAARLVAGIALRGGQQAMVALPEGYDAVLARVASISQPGPTVLVGQQVFVPGAASSPLSNEAGAIPVSVGGDNQAMVNVQIDCEPSSHLMDAWRIGVYQQLVLGYERQLAAWRKQASPTVDAPSAGGPS